MQECKKEFSRGNEYMDNNIENTKHKGTETFYPSRLIPPPPPLDYLDKPLIEPTEPVSRKTPYINTEPYYSNPYEHSEPYYHNIPSIPPPLPKQPKKRAGNIFLLWIVSIGGILLVILVLFWGINGLPWQQSQVVTLSSTPSSVMNTITPTATPLPTATPTPLPTATPLPTPTVNTPIMTGNKAPYPASQIIGYFYRAGLTPYTYAIDTNWSCCTYYPEGGAGYWIDTQTGISMDLATFAGIDEAQIDGKNLADKGIKGYIENYCLLSYEGNPSDVQSYLNIMAQVCTY
jgi:hypothetical protein